MSASNNINNIEKLNNIVNLVNNSEISSIKSTIAELIRLINDPKSSANDLKNVIEIDPPLSAKLLKLANSAYYGFPRTISDLQEAIVCVGFDALKEIALTQKVCELFSDSETFAGYSRQGLWKHSVAVAICGKFIYQRELREKGSDIYIAGILHDIGIIIEDQFLLKEFYLVLDNTGGGKVNFPEIEQSILGFNHADIGKAIAIDWNFPEALYIAIGHHHAPINVDPEYEKIALTLYLSNSICLEKKIGFCDAPIIDSETFEDYRKRLNNISEANINKKSINQIIKEVEKDIAAMEKAGWF